MAQKKKKYNNSKCLYGKEKTIHKSTEDVFLVKQNKTEQASPIK